MIVESLILSSSIRDLFTKSFHNSSKRATDSKIRTDNRSTLTLRLQNTNLVIFSSMLRLVI